MDPRSIKYLEEQGIKNIIHNPKRISKKMLDYFDFFIAIDLIILNELNLKFPKYKQKFFLASSHLNSINLSDPFKMNKNDYESIMNNIKITSDTINL